MVHIIITLNMYIPVEMWLRQVIEILRYEGEIEEMSWLLDIANDVVDEFGGKGRE